MTKLTLAIIVFCFSSASFASREYIDSNLIRTALESIPAYGSAPGVGAKSTSCLLCHNTAVGGPGNVNGSFGNDFRQAAIDLGLPNSGAQLPATGSQSLATIFADSSFASSDSDGDGVSNGEEFSDNTDPADSVGSGSSGGGGGGCGSINKPGGPFNWWFLLFLPFLVIAALRQARQSL